jgi:hypothetical protein
MVVTHSSWRLGTGDVSFFFEIRDVSAGRGGVVKIITLFACVPIGP